MAKRLASSGREKLEQEICHKFSLLNENTAACEDYILELEALLRQQTLATEGAQSSLAGTENKLAQAVGRIEAQKDDIQAMRTDAKLAALQQSTTDKELSQLRSQLDDALNDGQVYADELKGQLAAEQKTNALDRQRRDALEKELVANFEVSIASDKERRDAIEKDLLGRLEQLEVARAKDTLTSEALATELDALHLTINEYRECDKALRERIVVLEQLLAEERKKAGQDLLLRIMELETMLESERNKVDDLDELPTVVHVSHASTMAAKTTKSSLKVSSSTAQKTANKQKTGR